MPRALMVLPLLVACSSPSGPTVDFKRAVPSGATGGAVVARFTGETITTDEVALRFAEMNPYARARYQTLEQRKDYVEGLARFELLSREAIRRGLHNDPDVVEAAKRVMVQTLLKQELDEKAAGPTDAQVKAWYDSHHDDFVKPAMTRLSHIAFAKDHRAAAEDVLRQALALAPMDYASFGKLAREHSEDPKTRALDGDMRFLADDELAATFGPELRDAALTLEKVGDVFPALVETSKALHVIKLQGRQQALDLSLEQASVTIRQIIANDSRQERYRALLERLKSQAKLEISDEALGKVVVDLKAPTVEVKGPQPGFVPGPQGVGAELK